MGLDEQLSVFDNFDIDIVTRTSTTVSIVTFNQSKWKQWFREMVLLMKLTENYRIFMKKDEWC